MTTDFTRKTYVDYSTPVVDADWLNGVQGKIDQTVSVFDFIPRTEHAAILAGTSTYNATPSIQDAINFAISRPPCRLVFPTGKYKCDAVLGTYTASYLTIDFQDSILDFGTLSTGTGNSLLKFEGTYSTGVVLTTQALENQNTVACVSSGFAVGDLVRIYSETFFDPGRTDTRIGELNFIESIPDAASVTVSMPLQSAYTVGASAKIEKLSPVKNVCIKNGTFWGPAGNDQLRGWRFQLGLRCVAENMRTLDIDYLHAQLTDCMHCTVRNCYFEEAKHNDTAYGVSFADASQDCIAIGNHFEKVRHSLSTNNNTTTSYGVVRRIKFEANVVRDSEPSLLAIGGDAIDTHAGADYIDIINNDVHTSSGVGINVEARHARIIGNKVKHTVSVGIYFHPYQDTVGEVLIADNYIEAAGDGAGTDPGIFVLPGGSVSPNRVTIVGNHISSTTSEGIRIIGLSSSYLRRLVLAGNNVNTTSGSSGVRLGYVNFGTISGNISSGGTSQAFLFEDCDLLSVNGNSAVIEGTATNGYCYRFTGTGTRNNVVGSLGNNGGTYTNSYGVHFADTITYSAARSCNFANTGTAITLGAGVGNAQSDNL